MSGLLNSSVQQIMSYIQALNAEDNLYQLSFCIVFPLLAIIIEEKEMNFSKLKCVADK